MGGYDALLDDLRATIQKGHPDLAGHFGLTASAPPPQVAPRQLRPDEVRARAAAARPAPVNLDRSLGELAKAVRLIPRPSPADRVQLVRGKVQAVMAKAQQAYDGGTLSAGEYVHLEELASAAVARAAHAARRGARA